MIIVNLKSICIFNIFYHKDNSRIGSERCKFFIKDR